MNTRRQILLSVAIVTLSAGAVGLYARTGGGEGAAGSAAAGHNHAAVAGGAEDEALNPVRLSDEGGRRIGITYATAALKPFRRTVSTVGSVTYDETRLVTVNPRIEGWIERLYVDFTGAPVRRGQPLMEVYSPMLVSAQEELILARRLADQARAGGSERAYGSYGDLLEAARRRLRYWDVPDDEIARIEASGTPRRTVTLRAPANGVVVEKSAFEGSRIMPGMDLFRIADLSRVWVEGEVFEKDLSLVRLGQPARLRFDAYPGERFDAVITYVYPDVTLESRTGRVRLELANPDLRIKPGMYAQVELQAAGERQALLVPRSAVHSTGMRSLVFVRHGDTLMPHEVTLGLAAGSEVEILAGIEPGMEVVASANFLIDAESNMGASMGSMSGMDADGGGGPPSVSPAPAADPHAGHAEPGTQGPAAAGGQLDHSGH